MASSALPSPTPALAPPHGVTSNFVNPKTLRKESVVAVSICLVLASTTFSLRCYARLYLNRAKREWIAEDWLATLSFAGLCSAAAIITYITENKGGAHMWNLTEPEAEKILKYHWVGTIVYGPAILFTKLTILFMFLRIFCPQPRSFIWWSVWTLAVLSTAFYTAITVAKIFQCTPHQRIWDRNARGRCIRSAMMINTSGLFNTLSDVGILLIPVKPIWRLKMSVRKRAGAYLILTLGAVAPVFSVTGLLIRISVGHSDDRSHHQPLILLWATAELATGTICACLPASSAVFRAFCGSRRPGNTARTNSLHCTSTGGYGLGSARYGGERDWENETGGISMSRIEVERDESDGINAVGHVLGKDAIVRTVDIEVGIEHTQTHRYRGA